MRSRHVLLAVLIAAVWGFNFVPIKIGLEHYPPLFFAALRFTVAALPAVFVVRRPPVPARWLLLVGLPLGVGQFGLLFIAMRIGMPAGLSSVVLQLSALFTALVAWATLRERLSAGQIAGMAVAFGGVAWLGVLQSDGTSGPLGAFLLCIVAAFMWGLANVAMRRMNAHATAPVDSFGFMVWVSLVPPLPMLALSLAFEGPHAIGHSLAHPSAAGLGALAYIAYLSTLGGYGLWGLLMRRYEASTVGMYSLLVPPFGLAAAVVVLHEHVSPARLGAAALIVGGVALGAVRIRPRRTPVLDRTPDPVPTR
ncbi:EamA family transporter [Actinomadura rupiterrae]|uniref:EamA family transporter n=1 Tax=Actinomadura rupiterrae TaxID=559627 RepID=UPI0020A5533B|nr:EamA family transporter [Actinomadura rupiterrae]MCP2343471.1 O-acetylserine/cysteine efflux transporter [Actinomadura rupiterrae]